MNNRVSIDISFRAILKVIGVLLGLWFLYAIRDIAVLFFFVIIIVMALAPIVDRWQKHMSRPLAVALLLVLILAVVTLIVSLLVPPLVNQSSELARNLPTYSTRLDDLLATSSLDRDSITQRALQAISDQISSLSGGVITTTLGFLSGFVTFLTVIVLSVYLLIEEQGIRHVLISLLPLSRKESVVGAVNKIGDKLGAWLRGQLLLMLIIGATTMIWTSILDLPYALPLGLWAGLTEVLPFIGPILGGIPIVLIALLDSPIKALIALVLLAIVQQVESNFIVPKVMQRSVGLSPVIVILALLIGAKLFGIVGTILAVPVAATVSVIIQEWPKLSRAIDKAS